MHPSGTGGHTPISADNKRLAGPGGTSGRAAGAGKGAGRKGEQDSYEDVAA